MSAVFVQLFLFVLCRCLSLNFYNKSCVTLRSVTVCMDESSSDLDTVTNVDDPSYRPSRHMAGTSATLEQKHYPTRSRSSQEDTMADQQSSSDNSEMQSLLKYMMEKDEQQERERRDERREERIKEEQREVECREELARLERIRDADLRRRDEERMEDEHRREMERKEQEAQWRTMQEKQLELETDRLKLLEIQEDGRKVKQLVRDLPKLADKDEIFVYMSRFESVMIKAKVDPILWSDKLKNLLTGRALSVWDAITRGRLDIDFESAKTDFYDWLASIGIPVWVN